MKFLSKLEAASKKNSSLLCVGLDPSSPEDIFSFNRSIIDATKDLVCAYKPNMAFYESAGQAGLEELHKTIEYIQLTGIPVILDAKRADIGNTSAHYAKAVFDIFMADAVTVNPYMGFDSIEPFLKYEDKGIFVLCLTSNPGSADFQTNIYLEVARKVKEWNKVGNCGLVVGATKPEQLKKVREIVGDMPILIPGVGAQQGDLKAVVGKHSIINASRSIIYAKDPKKAAQELREKINSLLS